VALADVYDALTSRRPYKEPFTTEETRKRILEGRGTHFDPAIVDAFLAVEPLFLHVARTWGDKP
jgi:putative two-component system response regulator